MRVINTGITTLQVILAIAMFVINELSTTRMGFMRYVVFITQKIEAKYPVELIGNLTIAILLSMYFIVFLYLLKNKKGNQLNKKALRMLVIGILVTIIYVIFTLTFSTERIISYYFISLILFIISFLQGIKTIINVERERAV